MTRVTVVVPAYNEGETFAGALVTIADYFSKHRGGGYDFNYLIVDDGSRDETYAVASSFAGRRSDVRVLQHDRNRGLGAALRTAFAAIDSDIAVVLDADLELHARDGNGTDRTARTRRCGHRSGIAYAHGGSVSNVPLLRRILSREANRLLSLATCGRFATLTCMVRAYRVEALRRLNVRKQRHGFGRRDAPRRPAQADARRRVARNAFLERRAARGRGTFPPVERDPPHRGYVPYGVPLPSSAMACPARTLSRTAAAGRWQPFSSCA